MITLLLRAYLFPKRERTREEWLKRGKRFFPLLFLMFDLGRKEEGGGPKKKGKKNPPPVLSLLSPISISPWSSSSAASSSVLRGRDSSPFSPGRTPARGRELSSSSKQTGKKDEELSLPFKCCKTSMPLSYHERGRKREIKYYISTLIFEYLFISHQRERERGEREREKDFGREVDT